MSHSSDDQSDSHSSSRLGKLAFVVVDPAEKHSTAMHSDSAPRQPGADEENMWLGERLMLATMTETRMRSDQIKRGFERRRRTRSLSKRSACATRISTSRSSRSSIRTSISCPARASAKLGAMVKQAVRDAGGVPFEFNTIGVDDGIAMGHAGMKFSLPSRELIADASRR